MSFASQAREEIAQRSLQLQKDCCVRAAAYGIACFAKYFDAKVLHRFQLHGPQRIEVSQAIALKQCPVSFGDKISHSRPSKKRTI